MLTLWSASQWQAQMGNADADDFFGTVPRSMATLFQMMSLDSWMSAVTRPVGDVYVGAFFFFIGFVVLASLGETPQNPVFVPREHGNLVWL